MTSRAAIVKTLLLRAPRPGRRICIGGDLRPASALAIVSTPTISVR